MPAWLIALGLAAIKSASPALIQIAINLLKKTGVITDAQAIVDDAGVTVLHAVGNIHCYSSADDFPKEVKA